MSFGDSSALSWEGATDMESLRAMIAKAETGTGEIARCIELAKFRPGQAAFTNLLQFVSKLRQPEKAAEIFEAMESKANVKPNAFSYSALISALGRMGQWQDAERYFLQMKECSENDPTCKPNAIAYASMITAYEKGGQFEKALEAFYEQCKENVEPDVITYSSLINACERAGEHEKAVMLVDDMHSRGLKGTTNIYSMAIYSCRSNWRNALEIFLGMQCAGADVTPETASVLMLSLCAADQIDHALWLYNESSRLDLTLDITAYISLMILLGENGDSEHAFACYKRMQAVNAWPNDMAAGALLTAYNNDNKSSEATELNSCFHEMGIRPIFTSSRSWTSQMWKIYRGRLQRK